MKKVLLILPILLLFVYCKREGYLLNVTVSPQNGGSVSIKGGMFERGTVIELVGTPSEGHEFIQYEFVQPIGDTVIFTNPIVFTMNCNKEITVVFEDLNSDMDCDGVIGYQDKCRNTPFGDTVDENGCSISQKTFVPDDNFEQILISLGYDDRLDDYVITKEIENVTSLEISGLNIFDLTGIEDFKNLVELWCEGNNLKSLDVSNCSHLSKLMIRKNQLESLNVSNNTRLRELFCGGNEITHLDVSRNEDLIKLSCENGRLTEIDVSKNTRLTHLHLNRNQLTNVDVSYNTVISTFGCENNELRILNVENNVELQQLWCYGNQLENLNVSTLGNLTFLGCESNSLTSLDVSNNLNLGYLRCEKNQLTSLDVINNTKLYNLDCSDNQLEKLDVSNCRDLLNLYCYNNSITCIQVNQTQFNNVPGTWRKDDNSTWSVECDY